MIRSLRSIRKQVLAILFTFGVFTLYMGLYGLFRLLGIRYERLRNPTMTFWGHGMARIYSIRIVKQGNPPKPPFFLISNHLSYLDTFLLFATTDCTFVAKKEVRSWPVAGYMVYMMGIIFVDRARRQDVRKVGAEIAEGIHPLQGVVLFPEGTTSSGAEILPLKTSLLEPAVAKGIPVHYVTIRYETGPGDEHAAHSVCWWDNSSFMTHLWRLGRQRSITATLQFSEGPVHSEDRKQLAELLHSRMTEQFIPIHDRELLQSSDSSSQSPSTSQAERVLLTAD